MILKAKKINKFVNYKDLKMESIHNVINLIKPNVYMTSIDLKDAFLSVSIHNDHQKFLKFMFGNLFQLHQCLMVMDFLWEYLLKYQKYLLDILDAKVTTQLYMKLIHTSKDMRSCLTNILDFVNLLRELCFVIHSDKLLLTPS